MAQLGSAEDIGRYGRREREEQDDVQNVARKPQRTSGIDFDQIEIDAAHYLSIYDADIIYSWTPRQLKNFIKGARLREIDSYEQDSIRAIFNAIAQNTKKRSLKPSDIYDANKARKQIDSVEGKKESGKYLERFRAAKEAMKSYHPQSLKKGG